MQKNKGDIAILAIESSCDETAAAVVVNGRDVRSNIIYPRLHYIPYMEVWFRKLHPVNILRKLIR